MAATPVRLGDLARMPDPLVGGHGMCVGCGIPLVFKIVLRAAPAPLILSNATGCLEVTTSMFPRTSWTCDWIHTAFENAAAVISGVEAMAKALKDKGRLPADREYTLVAMGGDGGTYDIGLQSLSGAVERGHRFTYVCYDNNCYANTGGQRSAATPLGASTTTEPAGRDSAGKSRPRKDLTRIMAAHKIPYAAQGNPARWQDLYQKARRAFTTDGPAFLNVLTLCPTEWKYDESQGVKMLQLALDTCVWPIYEVVEGKYRITYRPRAKKPVTEWLRPQARYRHLFEERNAGMIERIQKDVDESWEELQRLEAMSGPSAGPSPAGEPGTGPKTAGEPGSGPKMTAPASGAAPGAAAGGRGAAGTSAESKSDVPQPPGPIKAPPGEDQT